MNKFWRVLNSKLGFMRYMPNPWYWYGFGVETFWSGRIIHVKVGIGEITLDWRGDFIKDMVTGVPE